MADEPIDVTEELSAAEESQIINEVGNLEHYLPKESC
jgi:hypothetical protein